MVQNGQTLFKMVRNGLKWSKIVCKLPQTTPYQTKFQITRTSSPNQAMCNSSSLKQAKTKKHPSIIKISCHYIMGKETLSTEEIIFTFSFLAQQVVFMYHKPKKCIFAIQSAQNPNLSPLCFLKLLKDFPSCLRFKFQVPDVPFFSVPGFSKMRQKRQKFTKISKMGFK